MRKQFSNIFFTFEKPENKRQMYGSQSTHLPDWLPYICLLFLGFSNVCHFACVWHTALKLGCINNLDTLFLVTGLISFIDEIQFMLISSRHICIRSMQTIIRYWAKLKHTLIYPNITCLTMTRKDELIVVRHFCWNIMLQLSKENHTVTSLSRGSPWKASEGLLRSPAWNN